MKLNDQQKAADVALDKILKDSEDKIAKAYANQLKSVRGQIADMYEKHAQGGKLTLADMTKYNRLDTQMKSISKEITGLTREVKKETFNMLESEYLQAHFREAHQIEFEAQQKLGFGQVNPNVINESIQDPLRGMDFDELFKKNRAKLMQDIQQDITQGLVRGSSYEDMARSLSKRLEMDMNRARMVARTEAHRVQSKGRLSSYEQAEKMGIELDRVWDAALSGNTRDTHRDLDGQIAEHDEESDTYLFESDGDTAEGPGLFGIASQDINCRCAVRSQVKGSKGPTTRRARISDEEYEKRLADKKKELDALSDEEKKQLRDEGKDPTNPKAFVSRSEVIEHKDFHSWMNEKVEERKQRLAKLDNPTDTQKKNLKEFERQRDIVTRFTEKKGNVKDGSAIPKEWKD